MAAGLGYIEFSTGDVLTATAANGYLASQVVMVFADAAARTTAITSPQEGMISYLKDTNATQYYSGSAWVSIGGASSGLTSANSTVNTVETTSSTSFTDLTTSQALTITTGTKALVTLTAKIRNNTAGSRAVMSFAVSGATTIAAGDITALQLIEPIASEFYTVGSSFYISSLTAGSNTFTAKFRAGANTAGFSDRQITVIDLGS